MTERASMLSAGILLVAICPLGCSTAPEKPSIVPGPSTGRRAIEALMATWKAGHSTGIIEPTSPRIQVVDTHRKPGQTLAGYEILGESADPRVRSYSIRLKFENPDEVPVVRYLMVGIDPILVFRQEDYDLLMHWEHPMDPDTTKVGEPPAPGTQ